MPDVILVKAWALRIPLDAAADERETASPIDTRPDPTQAGWPVPRKRKRRMDRDVDE